MQTKSPSQTTPSLALSGQNVFQGFYLLTITAMSDLYQQLARFAITLLLWSRRNKTDWLLRMPVPQTPNEKD